MIGHNHLSRLGISPGFTWDQWRLLKQFKYRRTHADLLSTEITEP